MVLPLVAGAAALGAKAISNPWVLGTLASLVPGVVDALTGSPTEAEARQRAAPERANLIAAMAARGMDRAQAEAIADQAISGKVAEIMDEGGLPPWLSGALTVGAGIGGGKLAGFFKGKLGQTAAKAAAAPVTERGLTMPDTSQRPAGPFVRSRGGQGDARFAQVMPDEAAPATGGIPRGLPRSGGPREYDAEYEVVQQRRLNGPFARARGDLEPEYRRTPPRQTPLIGEDPEMAAIRGRARAGAADRASALDDIIAEEAAMKERQMAAMRGYDAIQRNRGNFLPPGETFLGNEGGY